MIYTLFHLIFKTNLIYTLYFNFKMLPFKKAIFLPIFIYGKAKFRELNGCVKIEGQIHSGMIKIGKNNYYVRTSVPLTYWVLNGTIVFRGYAIFLNGGYLCVSRNGIVEFGKDFMIGSNYKMMCFEHIKIGNNVSITYDVNVYDTSFHYIEKRNGEIDKLTKPISIGDNVWIGNTCSITKGAVIPDRTIVANLSLVNKNFEKIGGKGLLLAGIPASIKVENIYTVSKDREKELDKQFGYDRTHL